jgi:hypothetical protein
LGQDVGEREREKRKTFEFSFLTFLGAKKSDSHVPYHIGYRVCRFFICVSALESRKLCRDTDIIYRTDRDLMDQNKDLSQEDFDRRLNSSGSRRYDEWAPAKQAVDADNEWRR